MNRFLGIVALNGQQFSEQLLETCAFRTPWWQPDHSKIVIRDPLAVSVQQRFVTPQCVYGLMPFVHAETGCLIVADVYLTDRMPLIQVLSLTKNVSDAELILRAYLQWGTQCTHYLYGRFAFVIWDPRTNQLFMVRDQLGQKALFYAYKPDDYLIFSNEFSPFRKLLPQVTPNSALFLEYAFDKYPREMTSYREINKLDAAQQIVLCNSKIKSQYYWQLRKKDLFDSSYRSGEDYYAHFRDQFAQATRACLRSHYPITAHLSGGLDSSSVVAQAANLLAAKNKKLHTFTSIPHSELSGYSYRLREYNETARVHSLVEQYPNLCPTFHTTRAQDDVLAQIKLIHPYIDHPLRNIFNCQWYFASLHNPHHYNGRILLTGEHGNATISWAGLSPLHYLRQYSVALHRWLLPSQSHGGFLNYLNPALLASKQAKEFLRHVRVSLMPHHRLLSGYHNNPLKTSVAAISLWYGTTILDPTADINLVEFCYNLPQWVFYAGFAPEKRKLLVRKGLTDILPSSIATNIYRGEQAADWYLQYNLHAKHWQQQSKTWSESTQTMLMQMYDVDFLQKLFAEYPQITNKPDLNLTKEIPARLMRYLSAGNYFNDL